MFENFPFSMVDKKRMPPIAGITIETRTECPGSHSKRRRKIRTAKFAKEDSKLSLFSDEMVI